MTDFAPREALALRALRVKLLATQALRRLTHQEISIEARVPEAIVSRFLRDPFFRPDDTALSSLRAWILLQHTLAEVRSTTRELFPALHQAQVRQTVRQLHRMRRLT